MYGNFRPATLDDYTEWLQGYIEKGGAPTHYYDYPFSRATFLYVTGSFSLKGERGVSAPDGIIVAPDATLDPRSGKFGHNILYYVTGHMSQDQYDSPAHRIPVYDDEAFLSIRGIDNHIERLKSENEESSKVLGKKHGSGNDGSLSSANDCWTGDPEMDRAILVERALQERP